ncbi:MAG: type II toxin-antitoxin system VapC family toxin [Opitutales bacterium]
MSDVLDNTVLIDFWAGEPEFRASAVALVSSRRRWTAPGLWKYEFGNVMNQLVRLQFVEEERKRRAFLAMERVLETVDRIELLEVDRIVGSTGLKFYDASYVWLARAKGCFLYTRDREILRACPDVARPVERGA